MTHPNASGSKALMARSCTSYEGTRGPQVRYERAPPKNVNMGVWRVAYLKKVLKKEEEKNEEVMVEKDAQVVAEEELKEVDLGSDSQEPRPISISASLTEKEKSELVLLLKEFKDVFAWDYSEMPGLDPKLIAHTLNVDP